MSVETVQMDDQALFDSATSNEAPTEAPAAAVEAPATEAKPEQQPDAGPARDEHGRFAPKDAKPETHAEAPQPEAAKPQNADAIPPWRLREEAEARRSAEARAAQLEAQNRHFEHQLRQLTEKPKDPPDLYANPDEFVNHNVRQAVDPIAQQLAGQREYFSRRLAIASHGEETVRDAYKWLDEGSRSGDPRMGTVLQRAMNSIDPFEEIVTAYKEHRAISTVGGDPQKWFEAQLAEAAKDPAKRQELLTKLGGQNGASQPNSIVKLPPSLTGVRGAATEVGTMADADLYAHATR